MIIVLLAVMLLAPGAMVEMLIEEGGPVETVSAAGYLVALVLLLREASAGFVKSHSYFVVLLLAMCLRELDFHNLLTTMSITKTRFYVSAEVPVWEKVLAVAGIGVLAWAGIAMVRRHWSRFARALARTNATAYAVVAAIVCAGAAKSLDGLPRKLDEFGVQLAADSALLSRGVEEVLEMGIPAFLVVAVLSYFTRERYRAGPSSAR